MILAVFFSIFFFYLHRHNSSLYFIQNTFNSELKKYLKCKWFSQEYLRSALHGCGIEIQWAAS